VAREIELQASLQHPSIVQIYAAFEDKEGIYVVQEFALGGDLYAQLAQAGGYLAEDQVAGEVMVPVLAALGHMHDKVGHVSSSSVACIGPMQAFCTSLQARRHCHKKIAHKLKPDKLQHECRSHASGQKHVELRVSKEQWAYKLSLANANVWRESPRAASADQRSGWVCRASCTVTSSQRTCC